MSATLAACDDDDPAGLEEIEGYEASLSGANEVPSNASTATVNLCGTATTAPCAAGGLSRVQEPAQRSAALISSRRATVAASGLVSSSFSRSVSRRW